MSSFDPQAMQRRFDEFYREYSTNPEFLDRQFQVPSVSDLLSDAGVVGVSRFIEMPSFAPERIYTFMYRDSSIEISAVVGATSVWYSVPQVYEDMDTCEWAMDEVEPFEPDQAFRQSAILELPSDICPPLIRSWDAVRIASADAGECETETLDGIGYQHRVADREHRSDARWNNPKAPEHPRQIALVLAYMKLLGGVRLYAR